MFGLFRLQGPCFPASRSVVESPPPIIEIPGHINLNTPKFTQNCTYSTQWAAVTAQSLSIKLIEHVKVRLTANSPLSNPVHGHAPSAAFRPLNTRKPGRYPGRMPHTTSSSSASSLSLNASELEDQYKFSELMVCGAR